MNCECKCHRICHTCGRPFIGPNDYHINCADTIGSSSGNVFQATTKNRFEPWPLVDDATEKRQRREAAE